MKNERWLQTRDLRAEEYYLFSILTCYDAPPTLDVLKDDYKKSIWQTKRDVEKLMKKGYVTASTKVLTKATFSVTKELK